MALDYSYSRAWHVQKLTIWALCLREIHGKHGKSKLGYLWQLTKTGFNIAAFWGIREMGGFAPPAGLSTPLFLLGGFIPWFIFNECIDMTIEAVQTNKALLTFPQISCLDLYLSSALVVWATEVVVMIVYAAIVWLMGYSIEIHNLSALLSGLIGLGLCATGLGLCISALTLYVPVIEKIVPMIMRVLFFSSGIFFSIQQTPSAVADILLWNPLLNYIELIRGSFASPLVYPLLRLEYTFTLTICSLALGLLLERYVRFKQEVEG